MCHWHNHSYFTRSKKGSTCLRESIKRWSDFFFMFFSKEMNANFLLLTEHPLELSLYLASSVWFLHRIWCKTEDDRNRVHWMIKRLFFRSCHYNFVRSSWVNVCNWRGEKLPINWKRTIPFFSFKLAKGDVCVCVRSKLIMLFFVKSLKESFEKCTKQISMWTKWLAIKLHYCWTVNWRLTELVDPFFLLHMFGRFVLRFFFFLSQ